MTGTTKPNGAHLNILRTDATDTLPKVAHAQVLKDTVALVRDARNLEAMLSAETPEERRRILMSVLDATVDGKEGGLTDGISAHIFRNSPLENQKIESMLGWFLANAHERKVRIGFAHVELTDGTWKDYIKSCEKAEGKLLRKFFVCDPDNRSRIRPSEELAAWMNERLATTWGYSPVVKGSSFGYY